MNILESTDPSLIPSCNLSSSENNWSYRFNFDLPLLRIFDFRFNFDLIHQLRRLSGLVWGAWTGWGSWENSARRVDNSVWFDASSSGVSFFVAVPTVGSTLLVRCRSDCMDLFSPMCKQKADEVYFASTDSVLSHTPILIDWCATYLGKLFYQREQSRSMIDDRTISAGR